MKSGEGAFEIGIFSRGSRQIALYFITPLLPDGGVFVLANLFSKCQNMEIKIPERAKKVAVQV